MVNPLQVDTELIERLIRKRAHDAEFDTKSESDIRSEYIDPLFTALGWDVANLDDQSEDEWRRERPGIDGRADYIVSVRETALLAIEAKRAGGIKGLAERGRRVDRTAEEKQVLRYTRARRIPWAVLTNFDRLLVFDADGERLLLGFNSPQEYLSSLTAAPASSIRQLSYGAVTGGSLEWLRELALKHDVDSDFLGLLQELRLILARDLLAAHQGDPRLQREDGTLALERLLAVVQRILDRLILIRFADDHEILRQHDLLANLAKQFDLLGEYHAPDELHAMLVRLWAAMDRTHDTTIFQRGHLCEILPASNAALRTTIDALNDISFRKFTTDILGATYESYLGTTLELDPSSRLVQRTEPETRRWTGIFYTPPFIVASIVERTLTRKLKRLVEEHDLHAIERVRGLTVLDPACGSGSFLIRAYDVLAGFYRELNGRIDQEFDRLTNGITDPFEQVDRTKHLPRKVVDYPRIILTEHLYGVDIDGEAAEIATLNLVMRAFRELHSLGRPEEKLPLILNQNIKVGNSLVSPFGAALRDYAETRRPDLVTLIQMRRKLAQSQSDQERLELLAAIGALASPAPEIRDRLAPLPTADVSRPFDWIAEFPEVWLAPDGAPRSNPGFAVVVGNPPYVRIQRIHAVAPLEAEAYRATFASARSGNYDTYVVFVEQGLRLLEPNGVLGYIVPHRFFTAQYGRPLRRLLSEGQHVDTIVHFGAEQVFGGATTYTALLILQKSPRENFTFFQVRDLDAWREARRADSQTFSSAELSDQPWTVAVGAGAGLFERLRNGYPKLGEVADIFVGLQTSADDIYIMKYVHRTGTGIVLRSEARARDVEFEESLVHPVLSGEDVHPFSTLRPRQFVLFPYRVEGERASLLEPDELEKNFPKTWAYLQTNRARLEARESGRFTDAHWYRLGRSQNVGIQGRVKVCVPRIVEKLSATLDATGEFFLDNVDVNGISFKAAWANQSLKYLTALLNSSLLRWYFSRVSVPFRGNYLSANKQYLTPLPIRLISHDSEVEAYMERDIIGLSEEMLALHRDIPGVVGAQERERIANRIEVCAAAVDDHVFKLYDLSPDEIHLVSGA